MDIITFKRNRVRGAIVQIVTNNLVKDFNPLCGLKSLTV